LASCNDFKFNAWKIPSPDFLDQLQKKLKIVEFGLAIGVAA